MGSLGGVVEIAYKTHFFSLESPSQLYKVAFSQNKKD